MKGMFFLLCKARGNLVLSTTRFSKCATDIFYLRKLCYRMEICQKSLLGDWTHVLEAMLLTTTLTETCRSKTYGIFSAMISRKIGALQGESFSFRWFGRLQKGGKGHWQRGRERVPVQRERSSINVGKKNIIIISFGNGGSRRPLR